MGKMSKSISRIKVLSPQIEYEQFFLKTSLLSYYSTKVIGKSYPVSIYTYDNSNYGLMIFKKNIYSLNLLKDISFIDEKKNNEGNKVYAGFLFEELSYFFEENEFLINKLIFSIENFKYSFIKEHTSKMIYLSFPLNNTMAISFNDSEDVNFHLEKETYFNSQKNELMVIKKGEFVYFFYLKAFKDVESNDLLLGKIVAPPAD